MRPLKNIIGNQYNGLTVLKEVERNEYGHRMFICRCVCGAITEPKSYSSVIRGICGSPLHMEYLKSVYGNEIKKTRDIVGKRYGELTVIEEVERDKYGHRAFMCRCSCGAIVGPRPYGNITRGSSCGSPIHSKRRHGETKTKLYRIWQHMKQSCYNHVHEQYKYRGAVGITMFDEWEGDFLTFKAWAVANGYTDAMTVARHDKAGNYCPENCYIKKSSH